MTRVAISQPIYGPTPWMAHISMVSAVAHAAYSGVPLEMRYVSGAYIDQNRNELVKKALEESECTHVFFIDQDMVLPTEVITDLLARDKEIVGASYVVKSPPYYPCALHFDENEDTHFYAQLAKGMQTVGSIGMGATLIRREVFEKMEAHFGDQRWFWINRDNGTVQGEDVHFGRRCREMGTPIWLDGDIECGHEGPFVFTKAHTEAYKELPDG